MSAIDPNRTWRTSDRIYGGPILRANLNGIRNGLCGKLAPIPKVFCFGQTSFPRSFMVFHRRRASNSVTERRFRAPARTLREVSPTDMLLIIAVLLLLLFGSGGYWARGRYW